ncbi:MAG: glycoside hydrolase family 15 protein [Nanoarchaeota archaeon]
MKDLIEKSKDILYDCCLENGSIVAANSDRIDYPKDVQNYRYVWPRDVSFTCFAFNIFEEKKKQKLFFEWLYDRCEDVKEKKLIYQNYYPNGRKRWGNFQPDQQGSILFAIYNWSDKNLEKIKQNKKINNLVNILADGLCSVWQKNKFILQTQDLWEERFTYPEFKQNNTYALCACFSGLNSIGKLYKNDKWIKTSIQIKETINNSFNGNFFMRRFGENNDLCIDASLLGLLWPFSVVDLNDDRFKKTINLIQKKLVKNYGVYRYQFDDYDGFSFQGTHARRGAGYWPLLNFWMAIVLNKMNKKNESLKYFNKVINDIENNLIPEQIFENKKQVSIKPLAWSHAMFLIAVKELKLY